MSADRELKIISLLKITIMRNLIIIALIAIIAIVLAVMVFGEREEERVEYTMDDARSIAENWMENHSPTYTFDGSGLELVDEREIDESTFEFTFDFESSAAGFGDRTDEMVAQVITPHTTVVVVEEGEVVSAITDGVYSELDEEMIEDEPAEQTVSVYFMTVVDGEEQLASVERVVVDENVEHATLEALLAGPTEEEEDMGYTTAINEGVSIISLTIEDGVAMADFSSELDEGVAGSAMVMAVRGQIEETLTQFDNIDEVVISVEGETEEILQP